MMRENELPDGYLHLHARSWQAVDFFSRRGYGLYKHAVQTVSLEEKVNEIRSRESFTSLEEMPETYVQAVVSVEDHRFYEHFGLDLIAIAGLWSMI